MRCSIVQIVEYTLERGVQPVEFERHPKRRLSMANQLSSASGTRYSCLSCVNPDLPHPESIRWSGPRTRSVCTYSHPAQYRHRYANRSFSQRDSVGWIPPHKTHTWALGFPHIVRGTLRVHFPTYDSKSHAFHMNSGTILKSIHHSQNRSRRVRSRRTHRAWFAEDRSSSNVDSVATCFYNSVPGTQRLSRRVLYCVVLSGERHRDLFQTLDSMLGVPLKNRIVDQIFFELMHDLLLPRLLKYQEIVINRFDPFDHYFKFSSQHPTWTSAVSRSTSRLYAASLATASRSRLCSLNTYAWYLAACAWISASSSLGSSLGPARASASCHACWNIKK